MKETKVKYLLIGNPDTLQEIGSYPPSNFSKKISKESSQIFKKFCASSQKELKDTRNKINDKNNGNYFFTITQDNIFYILFCDASVPQRDAFDLIDKIQRDNVPLLVDDKTGQLNQFGEDKLKEKIEAFESDDLNKIRQIEIQVEETKKQVGDNIKGMVNNINDLEDMDKKAGELKDNALQYEKQAKTVERVTWWQNFKWTLILVGVIVLLLIIILPISLSSGGGSKDDKKDDVKTNNATLRHLFE